MFVGHRDIIQGWVKSFVDRDNKIIKEFQTTFHSSFWEFYLYALFKELNFELDQTHDRPDFIIKKPEEIYVEAVVSNIKSNGVPESQRDMEDIMSMFIPPYEQHDYYKVLDEAIIRHSNAILSKRNNYIKNYSKCDWINNEKPYVIALSSYDQINYGREYIYPMIAMLYGKYYCPEKEEYEIRTSVKKVDTGADIPIGLFNNTEYADISAIIYSSTVTIGKLTSLHISIGYENSANFVYCLYRDYNDIKIPYKLNLVSPESPEYLSDGVFIFHNPNAKHKLSLEYFNNSCINQFSLDENGLVYNTSSSDLIVRTDASKMLFEGFDMLIKEYVRHYNKLSMKNFYNSLSIDGEPLNLDRIDFKSDCSVFIIGEDNDIESDGSIILCNYERPVVMPDEMLNHEAMKIADSFRHENRMGNLMGIYIARNQEQYNWIKATF